MVCSPAISWGMARPSSIMKCVHRTPVGRCETRQPGWQTGEYVAWIEDRPGQSLEGRHGRLPPVRKTSCEIHIVLQYHNPIRTSRQSLPKHGEMTEKAAAGANGRKTCGLAGLNRREEFRAPTDTSELPLCLHPPINAMRKIDHVCSLRPHRAAGSAVHRVARDASPVATNRSSVVQECRMAAAARAVSRCRSRPLQALITSPTL